MSAPTTTAGWYLDPEDPIPLRFHDGTDWTDDRRRTSAVALSQDHLPVAPASAVDPSEIARGYTHAKWLLGLSLFLVLFGLTFSLLPLLGAVSFALALQADRASREGRLVTARRLHLQARRWRMAAYLSIPILLLATTAVLIWGLLQLTP